MSAKKLFIDTTPICRSARSGVSHSLLQLLRAIDSSQDILQEYQVVAFAPKSLLLNSAVMRQFKNIQLVGIPLPAKLFQVIFRLGFLPPIDLFLGKGVYCFYDYRTLPLIKRSSALVCIHDLTFLKYPQFLERKNLQYLRDVVPKSIKRAKTIVCVSEAARMELADEYPNAAGKMVVLYNTVDDKAFERQSTNVIEKTRRNYGLPNKPFFLFIGNIEPRKNIPTLLTAYQELGEPANLPPLVLIGAMSWEEGGIVSQLQELQVKGYQIILPDKYVKDEDMPALISGAYCLVLPSFYEGFGYPPLHAILCGTPAIVSKDMPVNEIIGEYTTKVLSDDIDQLKKALRSIIDSGYREIAVNREKIIDQIGYHKTASRFLSILKQTSEE